MSSCERKQIDAKRYLWKIAELHFEVQQVSEVLQLILGRDAGRLGLLLPAQLLGDDLNARPADDLGVGAVVHQKQSRH